MSATLICPSCKSETSGDYNFCIVCNKQTKCLHSDCNKPLLGGKTFCFGCGRPVLAEANQAQQTKYVRRVKQKGDDYNEYTELNVTESVAIAWAPLITGQIMGRLSQRSNQLHRQQDASGRTEQQATFVEGLFVEDTNPTEQPESVETKQVTAPTAGAAKFFKPNGEYLVKMASDYKGKSWADQQRHFILLYTSAYYQLYGKPVPSKDHFKGAAEKASLYDKSNFSTYLSKLMNKELVEMGDGFVLSNDGEAAVKDILDIMDDPKCDPGYNYWQRSASDAVDRYRLTAKDKERLHQWAQENVNLGKLDIRNIKKARDYALLSMWIIAVHLKKQDAVRWNEAYDYLTEKYKAISATSSAFSKAMASQTNEIYFRKSGDLYFLTPDGQKKVEQWIDGNPVEAPSGEDTK